MNEPEILDAVENGSTTALVPRGATSVTLGTIRADTPEEMVSGASRVAKALADVIEQQGLAINLGGKRKHVQVEGWTTLAAMLGFLPKEEAVEVDPEGDYVATVALVRMSDGVAVGRASAACGSDEPRWAERPRFQRRSMAITRATSKVCRQAFSWVMVLAGYEATPAEEIIGNVTLAESMEVKRPTRKVDAPANGKTWGGKIKAVRPNDGPKDGKTGKPKWVRFDILGEDGSLHSTFDKKLAASAELNANTGCEMILTSEQGEKGYWNVVSVELADQPPPGEA